MLLIFTVLVPVHHNIFKTQLHDAMAGGEHHMFMFIVGFEHDTVLRQVRLPTNDTSFDKHFTNASMSVLCEQGDNKTCPVCSKNKYFLGKCSCN